MKLSVKKYTKIVMSLALLTFVLQACGDNSNVENTTINQAIQAEVGTVNLASSTSTKSFPAQLKSATRSEMGTKVMGKVVSIPVSIGDEVKKGDVLLRITDNDLRAQKNQVEAGLNQAKAQLASAKKDLNRFQALKNEGSATDKEMDNIQLQYTVAENNVTIAENKLKEINDLLTYTTIRAPYAGVVAAKYADEGDLVNPGFPLIAVEQTGKMIVEFSLPEKEISAISKGDSVEVTVAAMSSDLMKAVISDISSSGNKMSGQYWVELQLTNDSASENLRSGMFANVHISNKGGSSVYVPISALKKRGQLRGVYVLNEENEALLRWVRTGEQKGNKMEVLSGISSGERYVVQSDLVLNNAQKIVPAN